MITNEQVYERAMRMGIEGRCYPHEEIWDRATKALAEEAKRPKKSMVGRTFASFADYCTAALANGTRAYAMTYRSGKPEVVWFTDPSSVKFLGWAAHGSMPVIQ